MEFNALIKEYISPILDKYSYDIIEERENFVLFKSPKLTLRLAYDIRDFSYLVQIVSSNNVMISLTNYLVKNAFNLDLSLERIVPEIFIENLTQIFQSNVGDEMLKGKNINYLKKIMEEGNQKYSSKFSK